MRTFAVDVAAGLLMCAAIGSYGSYACICLFDLLTGGRLSRRDARRAF